MNPYLHSYFATRRRLKVGLVVAGAVAGAVTGAALTTIGKIVTGAPPATLANYAWNMTVFGLMGAVLTPAIIWSGLRRVPLWRTVAEPLLAGIAGAAIGVLAGPPIAFLILTPIGIGAAILRLNYAYRDKRSADRTLPKQS